MEKEFDWYFSYGSNMSVTQLRERTGSDGAENHVPCIARLAGYRFAFNMLGEGEDGDGGVYANIVQPGEQVIGVLYRCNTKALAALDVFEAGYDRRRVVVTLENGETREAIVYVAKPENIAKKGSPSADYVATIIRGATEHGLPAEYIQSIEQCRSDLNPL